MLDYVSFSTRVLFDLGWRRGYIREDQALPLRGSFPLVPRAASPPGRNPGVCTEHINCHLTHENITIRTKAFNRGSFLQVFWLEILKTMK